MVSAETRIYVVWPGTSVEVVDTISAAEPISAGAAEQAKSPRSPAKPDFRARHEPAPTAGGAPELVVAVAPDNLPHERCVERLSDKSEEPNVRRVGLVAEVDVEHRGRSAGN